MPFEIIRNDITCMSVDAIVNTANPRPVIGSGTDSAIHQKAGPELLAARKQIGSIPRGSAAMTPAFGLDAKYIFHTVGPKWQGGTAHEEETLRAAYDSALALAVQYNCETVAFPLMSAGSYGFPKDRALSIAISAFSDFLMTHDLQIYLVVFNKSAFVLSSKLFAEVESFVDEHYVEEKHAREYRHDYGGRNRWLEEPDAPADAMVAAEDSAVLSDGVLKIPPCASQSENLSLEQLRRHLRERAAHASETFTQALLRIIQENGWTESEVYNRVFMDRKLFNKIRNNPAYRPTKRTALLLCIALQLNLDNAKDFLGKAGFALTESSITDIVVMYFLQRQNYNIIEIDTALFSLEQEPLSRE